MSKSTQIREGAIVKIPTQEGNGDSIPDSSVSTQKLEDLAVTESKLSASLAEKINTSGHKNYIINGDMDIAQRGTSFVSAASNAYYIDRYRYVKSVTAVHTITQDTDVPAFADSGFFFRNSLRLNLTAADTSITGSENCTINYRVEGYDWLNLAQKSFTLSFWVKASTTGIYSLNFSNSTSDRCFVTEYTINSADTWEKKTIVMSPAPTAGTWNYTNGVGLSIRWVLAAGPSIQTADINTWQTSFFEASTNQVNGVNTGSTDFRITGIMLNEGTQAMPFRTFADSFQGDLAACQRYYEKSYNTTTNPGTVTGAGNDAIVQVITGGPRSVKTVYKVTKRAAPTITSYSPTTGTAGQLRNVTDTLDQAAGFTDSGDTGFCNATNAGVGKEMRWHWTAEAEL